VFADDNRASSAGCDRVPLSAAGTNPGIAPCVGAR
jgi:hypothetical protein